MSSERASKAWKKYKDTKKLLKAKPELSWLGDSVGMEFDQKIRFLNSILISNGLEIDLRQAMSVRFFQKFVHEINLIAYSDRTLDVISKLSVLSADDKPRKEKEEDKESEEKEENPENHREGTIE